MDDMNLIFYTIQKFFDLVFNDIYIFSGVTLGYVILFSALMMVVIHSILNLPSSKTVNVNVKGEEK